MQLVYFLFNITILVNFDLKESCDISFFSCLYHQVLLVPQEVEAHHQAEEAAAVVVAATVTNPVENK